MSSSERVGAQPVSAVDPLAMSGDAAFHVLEALLVGDLIRDVGDARGRARLFEDELGELVHRDLVERTDVEGVTRAVGMIEECDDRRDGVGDVTEAASLGAVPYTVSPRRKRLAHEARERPCRTRPSGEGRRN